MLGDTCVRIGLRFEATKDKRRLRRRSSPPSPRDTGHGAVVIGAMPAEWLATGQGMGYGMRQDANSFDYADIWAPAARFSLRDANA